MIRLQHRVYYSLFVTVTIIIHCILICCNINNLSVVIVTHAFSSSSLSSLTRQLIVVHPRRTLLSTSSTTKLNQSYSDSENDNSNSEKTSVKRKTVNNVKKGSKRFGAPRSKKTIVSSRFAEQQPSSTTNNNGHDRTTQLLFNDEKLNAVNDRMIQKQRRVTDDINCIHYYGSSMNSDANALTAQPTKSVENQCSGCTVMKGAGTSDMIPTIQSAKLFFSSPSILRRCNAPTNNSNDNNFYNEKNNNRANNNDDDNSLFYNVIMPTSITGWRTQAKLVATTNAKNDEQKWNRQNGVGCQFGLYQRQSHKVVPITHCSVHHPIINQAIRYLEVATQKAGIVAYNNEDNNSNRGQNQRQARRNTFGDRNHDNNGQALRYVQIQVERMTGQVCLTLVFHASELKQTQPALARLIKELNLVASTEAAANIEADADNKRSSPIFWHSIWCHCNDSIGNNVFSRSLSRWHRMTGPEYVREPIPVLSSNNKSYNNIGWMYYTPMSFRQGNLDGFDVIANTVARIIPSGSKVCELYAGVGILGLTALLYHYSNSMNNDEEENTKPLQWIRCSDENPSNPKCFYRSVDSLPSEMTGRQKRQHESNSNNNRYHNRNSEDKYNNKIEIRNSDQKNDNEDGMTIAELATMMDSNNKYNQRQKNMLSDAGGVEKVRYRVASAIQALKAGDAVGANVLIVDPPRKGLDDDVLNELCKSVNIKQPYVDDVTLLTMDDDKVNWCNDIQTLIYVSCGFDAFTRDCERLLYSSNSGWTLQSATGYVLFPGSDHVETLAIFQRR